MTNKKCKRCGNNFRELFETYNKSALYHHRSLVWTLQGEIVGCEYCFPIKKIRDGKIYFEDFPQNQTDPKEETNTSDRNNGPKPLFEKKGENQ